MSEVIRAFEKVLSFDFCSQELRTAVTTEGEPLFCGRMFVKCWIFQNIGML